MKVLILFCHPNPKSYNGVLRDTAVKFFEERKDEVKVVDLCALKFNAVGGPQDFTKLKNANHFDYQQEQKNASKKQHFAKEVKEQMDLLKWCDLALIQFPFYWFNIPAILKGYFDRILACKFFVLSTNIPYSFEDYFAYGGGTSIGGKMTYCCTTGAPVDFLIKDSSWYKKGAIWDGTVQEYLKNIWATAKLIKMELLTPHIVYGVNFMNAKENCKEIKDANVKKYQEHLKKMMDENK